MADLGAIARKGLLTEGSQGQGPPAYSRIIVCGDRTYALGGKSITEGNPAQPSLRMDARGSFRFRWTVASGARTFSIDVKQAVDLLPRPRVTIKANPGIGVAADVAGSAAGGAGWVTIGPLAIAPTSQGAVWVVLEALYDGQSGIPCYWDNIATT